MINVILPCAGEGKRLGLPYPKEIHQISYETALIDLSLKLLLPHKDIIDKVVIILTPQKSQIVTYLNKWKSVFKFAFCFFDDNFYEWPGSILSSSHLFSNKNLILLPDSHIVENINFPLVPSMSNLLDNNELVFAFKSDTSFILKNLGALKVDKRFKVTRFKDKPDADYESFNGYWTSFGFTKNKAFEILNLFTKSVQRIEVDLNALQLNGIAAFPVESYEDYGVWNNIFQYKEFS